MTKFTILDDYAPKVEAAQCLDVTPRTLDRYASEPGSGLRSVKVGGRRLYRRDDIKRWLERRERQAPSRRTA